jgi:hypothetical protein
VWVSWRRGLKGWVAAGSGRRVVSRDIVCVCVCVCGRRGVGVCIGVLLRGDVSRDGPGHLSPRQQIFVQRGGQGWIPTSSATHSIRPWTTV